MSETKQGTRLDYYRQVDTVSLQSWLQQRQHQQRPRQQQQQHRQEQQRHGGITIWVKY